MILLSIIRRAYVRNVTFNLDVSEQVPEVSIDDTNHQALFQQTVKLDDLEDGEDNSVHLHAGSCGTDTSSETSNKPGIFLHFEVAFLLPLSLVHKQGSRARPTILLAILLQVLAPRTHRAAQSIWMFLLAAGIALCATTIYFQNMPRVRDRKMPLLCILWCP